LGSGLEVMPRLFEQGHKFDLVFIDAHFDDEWEHFDWAVKLTRPGGCIIVDDVVVALFYKGLVSENEGKGEGDSTFMDMIGRDKRVSVALMPTVNTYPMLPTPVFNGFIIATVLNEQQAAQGASH